MRRILIAAAAGLMTLSALPVAAAASSAEAQMRPYTQQGPMNPPPRPERHDGPMAGPDRHDNGPGRPGGPGGPGNDRYGRWDNNWGARPAGPPRGWTRTNDWYRHVRACSQRYRSYDARTDRYVVRRGQTAMCRL